MMKCCIVFLLWAAAQSFCFQVVPEEAKGLLSKPFNSNRTVLQQFFSSAQLVLPREIWENILGECEPDALWSMSMVNRYFASYIRDDGNGLKARFLTPKAVWDIVYYSDLTIKPWMQAYFDRFTKGWQKKVRNCQGQETKEELGNHLLKIIIERAPDSRSLAMFFQDRNAPFPEVLLPDCIARNLWTAPSLHSPLPDYSVGQLFVYWLPADDSQAYFLDLLDDKMLAGITSQDIFAHLFDPVLLSHYLIPLWKGTIQLTDEEAQRLKGLSGAAFCNLHDYASHLHVAIYYLTGAIDRSSSWLMRKFYQFFEGLGYDVADQLLCRLPSDLCDYDAVVRLHFPISKILRTAEIWGLDAKELALKYDNAALIKDESVQAYLQCFPQLNVGEVEPTMVLESMLTPMSMPTPCFVRGGRIAVKRHQIYLASSRPAKRFHFDSGPETSKLAGTVLRANTSVNARGSADVVMGFSEYNGI